MAREVLDVFVLCVDYFGQLAVIHHLLKHPHFHNIVEFGVDCSIGANYLRNRRAPEKEEEEKKVRIMITSSI